MLCFFLDDNGTDDRSPVITMAGYVALAHQWAIFDKRSQEAVRTLRHLHACTRRTFGTGDFRRRLSS
jgi:hypothetical protein